MSWQRNDAVLAELREAQRQLALFDAGLPLLPIEQQERLAEQRAELERRVEELAGRLE